jgi:hypothetical protein
LPFPKQKTQWYILGSDQNWIPQPSNDDRKCSKSEMHGEQHAPEDDMSMSKRFEFT